jgi:hypothetical protein
LKVWNIYKGILIRNEANKEILLCLKTREELIELKEAIDEYLSEN